jgi:hypothetical protein
MGFRGPGSRGVLGCLLANSVRHCKRAIFSELSVWGPDGGVLFPPISSPQFAVMGGHQGVAPSSVSGHSLGVDDLRGVLVRCRQALHELLLDTHKWSLAEEGHHQAQSIGQNPVGEEYIESRVMTGVYPLPKSSHI